MAFRTTNEKEQEFLKLGIDEFIQFSLNYIIKYGLKSEIITNLDNATKYKIIMLYEAFKCIGKCMDDPIDESSHELNIKYKNTMYEFNAIFEIMKLEDKELNLKVKEASKFETDILNLDLKEFNSIAFTYYFTKVTKVYRKIENNNFDIKKLDLQDKVMFHDLFLIFDAVSQLSYDISHVREIVDLDENIVNFIKYLEQYKKSIYSKIDMYRKDNK